MANFTKAIPVILKHEGGYVNHPNDPGGATNYGISLRYLKDAGLDVNNDGIIDSMDIRQLTAESASHIYRKYWWNKYGYEAIIDQPLATKVFDIAVNMGPSQAHKLLQRAANKVFGSDVLKVDGGLGPKTLKLINELQAARLLVVLRETVADFYRELVRNRCEFAPFLKGWLNRAAS